MRTNILFFTVFLVSCNTVKENKDGLQSSADSNKVEKQLTVSSKSNRIYLKKFSLDTLVSDNHILYQSNDLKDSVVSKTYDDTGKSSTSVYSDRSVSLKIQKGSKLLFEKEINKHDFKSIIPIKEMPSYMISSFSFERVIDNGYLFSLLICKPETDICYPIELIISNDGIMHSKELEESEEGNE